MAEHFGTNHTERLLTPDAVGGLDDLIRHFDEPFADASAMPTMLVSRVAAESVKVVLSGDGGDEAFGGYARYVHDLREAALRRRLPAWFRLIVLRRLAAAWPRADWLPRALRWKSLLTNLSLDPAAAYASTVSQCGPQMRQNLMSPELRRAVCGHRPESVVEAGVLTGGRDPLDGMLAADIDMLLPDDFLTKVDRASMAYGLEVRPPLLDHELMELAAAVPSGLKVRAGEGKWLLKQIFEPKLPSRLASRAKQGFEIPLDDWLRGELAEQVRDVVLTPGRRLEEYVHLPTAQKLFDMHRRRSGRHGQVLWTLLVLGRWLETYAADSSVGDPLPVRLVTA